jgi:lipopolysaccharide biosynthesis glycosyltransferase
VLNSFRTHEQNKRAYTIHRINDGFTAEEAGKVRKVVEGFSFTAALAAKRLRASQDSPLSAATLDVAALKAGQARRDR